MFCGVGIGSLQTARPFDDPPFEQFLFLGRQRGFWRHLVGGDALPNETGFGVVRHNRSPVCAAANQPAGHGKIQTLRVKYKAHVEDHDYPKKPTISEGDKVMISETRPMSRDKRWRVAKVIEKAAKA